jgi:uncharacterized protein (DUF1684 family)
MTDSYSASIESWRLSLDERLRARNGWLALAGLFWLHEGANRLGADPSAEVVLPEGSAPSEVGVLRLNGGKAVLESTSPAPVRVEGRPAERVELNPDTSANPTFVELDDLRFVLLQRGPRYAIRLWDNRRRERVEFPGRRWFPVDEAWCLEAAFAPHEPKKRIRVPNELGEVREEESLGRVTFHVRGEACALEALEDDDGRLFLVFGDASNGRSTYPSGRFLRTEAPTEGRVLLDFNRAYNPPCAFTPYATCPLPPSENRLSLVIEAGEQYPPGTS